MHCSKSLGTSQLACKYLQIRNACDVVLWWDNMFNKGAVFQLAYRTPKEHHLNCWAYLKIRVRYVSFSLIKQRFGHIAGVVWPSRQRSLTFEWPWVSTTTRDKWKSPTSKGRKERPSHPITRGSPSLNHQLEQYLNQGWHGVVKPSGEVWFVFL